MQTYHYFPHLPKRLPLAEPIDTVALGQLLAGRDQALWTERGVWVQGAASLLTLIAILLTWISVRIAREQLEGQRSAQRAEGLINATLFLDFLRVRFSLELPTQWSDNELTNWPERQWSIAIQQKGWPEMRVLGLEFASKVVTRDCTSRWLKVADSLERLEEIYRGYLNAAPPSKLTHATTLQAAARNLHETVATLEALLEKASRATTSKTLMEEALDLWSRAQAFVSRSSGN